jgi:hypothetical protein
LIDKGAKFKGGNRGQGKKSEEWKYQLSIISEGLDDSRLNFRNILNRIEKAINKNSDFWEDVRHNEELIFFECSDGIPDSVKFKTIKNELTNLRKKTSYKTK